ncbi:pheromone-processing carboxypeptidase KEX1-like [Mercurialis annua]|uniref:pheromone-processing carboxypeptidase KEX1-like n=1 Tax=Mercurialis annua TaxID=3986 RepID=UPI00215E2C7D|nr:pheromone-processing carboxypeptidase KEX1-like [Mercurialis annua]XP_055961340.1 pheromone-processing carboxypeptidase KEX1-like [Mercurialis annua]
MFVKGKRKVETEVEDNEGVVLKTKIHKLILNQSKMFNEFSAIKTFIETEFSDVKNQLAELKSLITAAAHRDTVEVGAHVLISSSEETVSEHPIKTNQEDIINDDDIDNKGDENEQNKKVESDDSNDGGDDKDHTNEHTDDSDGSEDKDYLNEPRDKEESDDSENSNNDMTDDKSERDGREGDKKMMMRKRMAQAMGMQLTIPMLARDSIMCTKIVRIVKVLKRKSMRIMMYQKRIKKLYNEAKRLMLLILFSKRKLTRALM